jgi:N-ATPase, AtpR subunit
MSYATIISNPALLSAMLVAGFAFGLVYFAMLRRTAALHGSGHSWFELTMLILGRVAGAAILFTFAATLGAGPLLTAFLGFLLARSAILHTVRRSG